ncbi:hypothetical protein HRS9139_02702 [Pyrenophora teres f. teres]|uniref:Uncharacterized protein n=1 Tax=Pyrenophora teres f. teres TaxID=97479 RepID=A0A6S6W4Y8_9PLEO|nr:hypothetical protein HRS9139_02702 [Pyrenophora teres f. teres]KAE8847517.1 hypothetical protein HRS9122_04424 [Pyrenophora teres f. teres]CAE7179948.1 hypothetical protein PTTW11_06683 [Pyrenophora teres f. teres]
MTFALTFSAGNAARARLYLQVYLLRADVPPRRCRYLLDLLRLLKPDVFQASRHVKLVVPLRHLLRRLLRLGSYRRQRLADVKDIVLKRLERRHSCPNRHHALDLALQHRVVRPRRPVHKLLAEPADRHRVEEGGRCRGGSTGLPYRHAVEQVVAAARSLIAREADGLARLLAQSKMLIAGEGFSPQHDRKQKSLRLSIRKLVKKAF